MVAVVQGIDAAQLRFYAQITSASSTIIENPVVKARDLIPDILSDICRITGGAVKTGDCHTAGL